MILYNTSFHIDSAINDDFVAWLRADVVSAAMQAGLTDPLLCSLLVSVEPGCKSYALQFHAADLGIVERWEADVRPELLRAMFNRWGERALAFSTPMEILAL